MLRNLLYAHMSLKMLLPYFQNFPRGEDSSCTVQKPIGASFFYVSKNHPELRAFRTNKIFNFCFNYDSLPKIYVLFLLTVI